MPLKQNFEQQSVPAEQVLPSVLHELLRGAHLLVVQVPLQQSLSEPQLRLSLTHAGG